MYGRGSPRVNFLSEVGRVVELVLVLVFFLGKFGLLVLVLDLDLMLVLVPG